MQSNYVIEKNKLYRYTTVTREQRNKCGAYLCVGAFVKTVLNLRVP